MLVSQAHSFTQQARLAITLAWVAGYTNICTILSCNTVTSHVSGTVSNLGRDVMEKSWASAGFMLFLLASFFAGAAISAVLTETGRRRGWQSIYVLPMAAQALLLTCFATGIELHDPAARVGGVAQWWMAGVACVAMGLQNATITRISSGVVRTTHLTGVLTDLGSESVLFLFWLRDRAKSSLDLKAMARSLRAHPTARRLALLLSIIGSFALGAALGTLGYEHTQRWAMIPPVLFLLWIIIQDVRTPICEIEESPLVAGGSLDLPSSIAVYHLRKDSARRGKMHRLPDLLLWFDRLPEAKRIIVLDLGDVSDLNENAMLELKALVQRVRGKGRSLVIAGITPAQFRQMLSAGAGDVLDSSNVMPDLELAIARALVLSESLPPAA